MPASKTQNLRFSREIRPTPPILLAGGGGVARCKYAGRPRFFGLPPTAWHSGRTPISIAVRGKYCYLILNQAHLPDQLLDRFSCGHQFNGPAVLRSVPGVQRYA